MRRSARSLGSGATFQSPARICAVSFRKSGFSPASSRVCRSVRASSRRKRSDPNLRSSSARKATASGVSICWNVDSGSGATETPVNVTSEFSNPKIEMLEGNLVAILILGMPVHDQEIRTLVEGDQRMMPHAAAVVDALPRHGLETDDVFRAIARWRDQYQEWARHQRNEQLRAFRMALHQLDLQRELPRLGAHDADSRRAAVLQQIELRHVGVALGKTLVDGVVAAIADLDHIAIRAE